MNAGNERRWSHPGVLIGTAVLSLVLLAGKPWLEKLFWPLDLVDLAFHEAGHPIFGLLGVHFITVLGGTLMQLLMPAAALLHFLKRGEKASAFACLGWFGQNFLGIGRYMGDARAQQLELIGSGEHDWTTLFETMGLLTHDVGIGQATQLLGCLIMALAAAGVWLELRRARAES